jgi:hypothetical protein
LQYVFVIPCSPNVLGLSNFIFTSRCFFINSCISSISLFFSTFPNGNCEDKWCMEWCIYINGITYYIT